MHVKKMMDEALEELQGAEKYVKCAMKYRQEYPAWAKKYHEMAMDEMRHADNIFRMSESAKGSGHTPLEREYMDDQVNRYMEECAEVRAMLEMYREG